MKKAKNVFAKSVVISVPIVRLVWSVLKENLIIFVLFLIFTSIIYLLFGGIIPIILLAIFVSGNLYLVILVKVYFCQFACVSAILRIGTGTW